MPRRLKKFRPLFFESCEERLLLTATPSSAIIDESPVRFRMEVTNLAGAPIDSIETGSDFSVNVYVSDQRPVPLGVFAAYLDVFFDQTVVSRIGEVKFGEAYENALVAGGNEPGVLDEVGAVAAFLGIGQRTGVARESLLFSAPFRALDPGSVTFFAEAADQLPNSHVLLLGINQPIEHSEISFGSAALEVTNPLEQSSVSSGDRRPTTTISSPAPPTLSVLPAVAEPSAGEAIQLEVASSQQPRSNAPTLAVLVVPTTSSSQSRSDIDWFRRERFTRTPALASPRDTPPPRATDEGWIELPNRLRSPARRLELPESTIREHDRQRTEQSLWQHDELSARNGGQSVLRTLADARQRIQTREFLRITLDSKALWDTVASVSSDELIASTMIDIEEILDGSVWLELPESVLEELIAENESESDEEDVGEEVSNMIARDIRLRAARGVSLAIEVGMARPDSTSAEHYDVPESTADAEQADAGPPAPDTDNREPTAAPA